MTPKMYDSVSVYMIFVISEGELRYLLYVKNIALCMCVIDNCAIHSLLTASEQYVINALLEITIECSVLL